MLQKSTSKGRLSGELSTLAWVKADLSWQGLTEEPKVVRETPDQPGFGIASQLNAVCRFNLSFHSCL